MNEKLCPVCKKEGVLCEMEVKPQMFFWRGRSFTGLICPNHPKNLWDNPDDSFAKFIGLK